MCCPRTKHQKSHPSVSQPSWICLRIYLPEMYKALYLAQAREMKSEQSGEEELREGIQCRCVSDRGGFRLKISKGNRIGAIKGQMVVADAVILSFFVILAEDTILLVVCRCCSLLALFFQLFNLVDSLICCLLAMASVYA